MLFQFGAIYFGLKPQAGRPFGSVPLVVKSSFPAFTPFEPLVAVLSVYGEPESAGAVLVGFELQNDIAGPERMIIPYRVQFPRVSVRLHRK